ncbi:hypothetical protein M3Y98_00487800 [Aphelenchoides besseyi]|nr:hypothetical protein M3Y98_00487800 [Aphelenchoides besseyi]
METGTVCHANSAEVNNFMCTTSGLDERFFVTYKCPDHFVVDTFYGTKKLIAFDWSAITTNKNRTRKQGKFYLRFLHFVDEKHVYGTIICFSANVVAIISGTFDSATCVLKFGRFFVLNGWYDHHLLIDETTKRGSILLRPSTPGPMKHMAINFDDNQLSLGGTTEVPFTLHFPMKLDNKLYGFRADDMVNAHQLVEFSLADGTQTVHNIEIGNRTSKVFAKKSRNAYENLYYRFPFGNCDSLSTLVWRTVSRQSQSNPQFHQWFLSKVPSHYRCYPL